MLRMLPLGLLLASPAAAVAQAQPRREAPVVAVVLEATAEPPMFAAQRVDTRLQNVAEVVRQLGDRVASTDTTAYGVSRRRELEPGAYPPPPYTARYVLRVRLASRDAVQPVTAALAAAGATSVRVTYPRGEQ